ncbi:MAG: hypothetical protein KIT31_21950, partial [Deltaproteobacteria bacterium]|nr:hypothetical protein [Deltaproteobacteria bacterium]
AALREAAVWLARAPGTHRIVVLGDARLPARLGTNPGALASLVSPRTLIHTVAIADLGTGLERDDEGTLAPLARAARGMNVAAGLARLDATMLARPTSLDQASLSAPGWTMFGPAELACGGILEGELMTLGEGETCRWYGETDRRGGQPIVLSGLLWGERVTRVIRPEPSRARELARELSASQLLAGNDLQQQLVDLAARAVNSAWSLYGAWGGAGGYGDRAGGGVGVLHTRCNHCSSGTFGRGTAGRGRGPDVHLKLALERALATCAAPAGARVVAAVETTGEEIVDVTVTTRDPARQKCVEDALWSAWLVVPDAPPHATTVVELAGTP